MYNCAIKSGKIVNNTASSILQFAICLTFVFHLLICSVGIFTGYSTNFFAYVNTYVLFFLIVLYLFSVGINKHFLYFCFCVCFFIFLMGQKFFVVLDGGSYDTFLTFKGLQLSSWEYFTFINLMYFSLLGCFIGYFVSKPQKYVINKSETGSPSVDMGKMRAIIRVLYIITFICASIMQFEIVLAKRGMSYTDGYLINVDVNPVINIGNYLFLGMAFLYLSCRPSKKEMIAIIVSFMFVDGFLQMFVGRRALLAQSLFFIIWFTICYLKADEKKFTFKHFVWLCIFGVMLIFLFWIVEVIRSGSSFDGTSFLEIIENFCISTGGSDSTIANIIHYGDEFPKEGYVYYFSPIKDALFDNVVVRQFTSILTGTDSASVAQGLEYLGRHDSFAHWLSYTVNSDLYLKGYGMGSSYIAETYFAFGTLGVVIFNLILGFLIRKLSTFKNESNRIYLKATCLFVVHNLFVLPRGGVFSSATDFLYFAVALLIIKFISSLAGSKNEVLRS